MGDKKKKIQIPKSVSDLGICIKKFAKKHGFKLKGLDKKEKKRNLKKLKKEYSKSAIEGLNKAVKILSDNPRTESKKIEKVKKNIDNIITNGELMENIARLYKKDPDSYSNMIYFPHLIVNTILYYSQDDLSDDDKEIAQSLNKDELMEFCQKILRKKIKRYKKYDMDDLTAFKLAEVIPTSKLLTNNRQWYKKLIQCMYNIAETTEVDFEKILKAILKIDKKKYLKKIDLYMRFYSEFILSKSSNKNHSFTDAQKDLHESLIEKTLTFMDGLKTEKLRSMLKEYIKRRKVAESYKTDTKRVIKFTDYATSNSAFPKIKSVVQDLISDNSTNELYLS